jgi:hypothetical protein
VEKGHATIYLTGPHMSVIAAREKLRAIVAAKVCNELFCKERNCGNSLNHVRLKV